MSRWIANWNATYADNAQEAQPTCQRPLVQIQERSRSSINTAKAGVKAPDELQKDLTMLEYMSELKWETDDRRPEWRDPEDTRMKDNK